MLKIGLTGGIGSGKSTVSKLFQQNGVPVIDTDVIAHAIVQPGQPSLKEIAGVFGNEFIDNNGALHRGKMRELVYAFPEKKKRLEQILHPLIEAEMQRQLERVSFFYAIICIPLLLEAGWQKHIDRILVVDCPVEQQIDRVSKRDRLSKKSVEQIIAAQVSREQRLQAADDIINNSGPAAKLAEQIKKLHNLYLSLSTPQEN